jgi:hypothetical protein
MGIKTRRLCSNVPAPTLGFRKLTVSLSSICDLVAAYKNEQLPLVVHDELWRLIDNMKPKAELAIDPTYATAAMSGRAHSRSSDGL